MTRNIGRIDLNGTNSYQGGTTVRAGNLVALAASVNALGTGNVTVETASLVFGGSQAKLTLNTGATNSIGTSAWLFLSGAAPPTRPTTALPTSAPESTKRCVACTWMVSYNLPALMAAV